MRSMKTWPAMPAVTFLTVMTAMSLAGAATAAAEVAVLTPSQDNTLIEIGLQLAKSTDRRLTVGGQCLFLICSSDFDGFPPPATVEYWCEQAGAGRPGCVG